jgi:hypothetical protein
MMDPTDISASIFVVVFRGRSLPGTRVGGGGCLHACCALGFRGRQMVLGGLAVLLFNTQGGGRRCGQRRGARR